VLAKEIERAGIPTVFVTALPTIATMIGANRVLRGVAITSPLGDPHRSPAGEQALRRVLVERALALLETEVDARTVWEGAP
jgi:glycine/betaine/sarcosine/D-proline reductase family selenoprotein B